ncbi:MAG: cell division protein FtsZ [Saprospiraceae bacterium]|nr:cell division protein FtsZ [Saprospiraceae bacterium]
MKFDAPKELSSIIKVIGVGGGGSNAVNHMYNQGIQGVDFIVVNTDAQALDLSPVPNKVQIGNNLTDGLGAGSKPEVGKNAAIESIDELKEFLEKNTKMVFITAGMGGGTGTGGAPVIAAMAKEMGILTVAIVTVPFSFEGRKRRLQADEGIEELRKNVDTLLLISNDKLRELYGNLKLSEAFHKADDVLTIGAKGIAEIITVAGNINVDFNDVSTVMKDSGAAIMGSGMASGPERATKAIEMALASPLLNDNSIKGASDILLYISSGEEEIQMDEVTEITDFIQFEAGSTAEIIWGNGYNESLGDNISITLIATGFKTSSDSSFNGSFKKPEKTIYNLDEVGKEIKAEKEISFAETEKANEITIKPAPKESKQETVEFPTTFTFELDSVVSEVSNQEATAPNEPVLITRLDDRREEEPIPRGSIQFEPIRKSVPQDDDEIGRMAQERIRKLREISIKIKSPGGLTELENQPAYVRRNIELSDVPLSSETEISRYTLSEDDDKVEIRANNSFLHDNVD